MDTHPTNLPLPLTRIVGREHEASTLRDLLAAARLVTLAGPAGCGKTRLAIEVAGTLRPAFPGGVWLVELAPVSEPALVVPSVASALGVREQVGVPLLATLSDELRSAAILLVLDNAEHLVGPAGDLAVRLLGAGAGLRILVTSREPLGVAGETVFRVGPLPVPETRQGEAAELLRSDAVRLFVERARAAHAGFALTDANAPAVAQICRRLDGIPLAIELAAAWVETLAVDQIAGRLDDRFRLLAGRPSAPRHQTLRGALEWSYDLLGPPERVLFDRLAVFAGGCTLDAIEVVAGGEGLDEQDVLPCLARLVDASLVMAEEHGPQRRYRLLETVRLFARERLVIAGDADRVHERHARHFLALAETAEPGLWGTETAAWLDRLEAEHDNLRAALRWSAGRGEADIALRLGAALGRFWRVRNHVSEGLNWLTAALAWEAEAFPAERARALVSAGHLARDAADYDRAAGFYADALALRRAVGDERGAALVLNSLGVVAQFRGDIETALAHHEESLRLFRRLDDERGVALSLVTLATMAQLRGDLGRASTLYEESLAAFRALEDHRGIAGVLNNLGNLASARGDLPGARRCYDESIALFRALGDQGEVAAGLANLAGVVRDQGDSECALALGRESVRLYQVLGDKRGIAGGIASLARTCAARGEPARAAWLLGLADALRETAGDASSSPSSEALTAALRDELGADAFGARWTAGRHAAIDDALADHPPDAAPVPDPARQAVDSWHPLTRRERDVAELIAGGLTNRAIAERLFISERTVDTHVEHILAKLGMNARAQVASWVAERNLSPAAPP